MSDEPPAHLREGGVVRDGFDEELDRLVDFYEEREVPAQVAQRDHGQPVAHQGIVGVVPFRPLGVHPDAAARHQVAELDQSHDQQLFQQVDMVDVLAAHNQAPVGPHF